MIYKWLLWQLEDNKRLLNILTLAVIVKGVYWARCVDGITKPR